MEQTEIVNQAEALDEKNAFAVYNHIESEFVEPGPRYFSPEHPPRKQESYGVVHGSHLHDGRQRDRLCRPLRRPIP